MIPFLKSNYIPIKVITEVENKKEEESLDKVSCSTEEVSSQPWNVITGIILHVLYIKTAC